MKLAVSVVILLVAAAANAQPVEKAADVVPEIKSIIDVLTVSGDQGQAGVTREKRQFGGGAPSYQISR